MTLPKCWNDKKSILGFSSPLTILETSNYLCNVMFLPELGGGLKSLGSKHLPEEADSLRKIVHIPAYRSDESLTPWSGLEKFEHPLMKSAQTLWHGSSGSLLPSLHIGRKYAQCIAREDSEQLSKCREYDFSTSDSRVLLTYSGRVKECVWPMFTQGAKSFSSSFSQRWAVAMKFTRCIDKSIVNMGFISRIFITRLVSRDIFLKRRSGQILVVVEGLQAMDIALSVVNIKIHWPIMHCLSRGVTNVGCKFFRDVVADKLTPHVLWLKRSLLLWWVLMAVFTQKDELFVSDELFHWPG